ncbi:hypothetical protein U6N72_12650, partial [Cutibacterium acnes]
MSNEMYRAEIVISVDDESAARNIRRAEERVNQAIDRMQRRGRAFSREEISPLVSVRDKLTEKVLHADKIIKKLDVAQASPLLDAQDKISNVVVRTNKLLDALDK